PATGPRTAAGGARSSRRRSPRCGPRCCRPGTGRHSRRRRRGGPWPCPCLHLPAGLRQERWQACHFPFPRLRPLSPQVAMGPLARKEYLNVPIAVASAARPRRARRGGRAGAGPPRRTRGPRSALVVEDVRGGGAAVAQELLAALGLVVLADRGGGAAERVEGAQEAAVGLVLPRDGAVALPAGAAELVEPAVVTGAREGVRVDDAAVGEGAVGELGPRGGVVGVPRGDFERVDAVLQRRPGLGVVRQFGRRRAAEQVLGHAAHGRQPPGRGMNPGRGPSAAVTVHAWGRSDRPVVSPEWAGLHGGVAWRP